MSAPESVVIAGAGLGGFQVAHSLREMGYQGKVVLVGDELSPPYHRPPLSKAFLLGDGDEAKLPMRPQTYYNDRRIELVTGHQVVAVDRAHRKVALNDDTVVDYDHLVFATGARNRPLPVVGADLNDVFFLRSLDEARALRARLHTAKRAVVIGAGFIGLEFAMAAVKLGVEVTVLEVADRPMARALSPTMSAIFAREHAKAGVQLMFNTQVMHLLGQDGRVRAVETVGKQEIPCELVVIGIGVQPNVEVAAACNLEIRNGIVVDEQLLTVDPNISAVGDCTANPNPYANGELVRLESVQNATDQARCVAARLVGKPTVYGNVPWFWSDQGDLKLQIAGLSAGYDQTVVRGDTNGTSCTVFCFRQGQLVSVETVNRALDHMAARKIVGQRLPLTPALAADESYELKQLLA
jgi:3-phenylpropionate/trans-cinnamate dioxygenase ferredoxin reductase component